MNIFKLSPEEAAKEIDKALDSIPRERMIEELKACGLKVREVKRMKLIDVLNMIAKGELEEGTEFKFAGHTYFYKRGVLFDREINAGKLDWFSMQMLCDEVEIIGEDTGRIKEINVEQFTEYNVADRSRMLFNKLNEVIRELNRRGE